ncbi:MAG TPA: imelysin family protein, partial [Anaerolineae bacterium]|nr:imelysin family protein [Anaerolineae bacterium]
LGFRFTMPLHTPIKKWPINTSFIEKFITEETDPIDEPFIESIGSTSKGLTAIEYLIFSAPPAETVAALTAEPRRLAYLVALTENLARKARELEAVWLPEGDNQAQAFIEADFSGNDVQGSLNMLVNEMIAALETTTNSRLNYPRKGTYGTPQPEAVESPYAQYSGPLIGANLRGVQQTFNAGLAGYLDFLQSDQSDQPLSATINAQFEQAVLAVEAISPSLQVAVADDPATVEQAYNEVRALLVLFKVDLANQMGVTVTFSDNDGD